ncbi:MAG: GIY-YIG nuclease family protein [Patescibacteria group bacterium]
MYYVYILESKVDGSHYVGSTSNLKNRLQAHNTGSARYSSTKKPFVIIWYCAFRDKTTAIKFELYLKHGSGYAFTKNHLI